jgi:MFS family permease
MLAVMFTVRLTMAFQFQSVAAVAPLLGPKFGVSLADIGVLIGLYFTPGVALSVPGGAIGQRLGDKATTLLALSLMLIGSLVMVYSEAWSLQIVGRLIAGAGGVLLNVQLTKMTADWFAGHEIATAMAIFVNSWPAGVALSLLTLPSIATVYGIAAVHFAVAASIVLALILLGLTYQPPAEIRAAPLAAARPDRRTVMAVVIAGLIWGLFNVGFATIFSFGPTMLTQRGWSIAAAGSAISIVLWFATVSVPSGGFISDRLKRPQSILVCSSILVAVLMLAMAHTGAVIPLVIGLGLISGLPAGPIMSLPARVLTPPTRAIGMGLFYTMYYAAMMLGPMLGGAAAKWSGSAASAFDVGALSVLSCPLLLLAFNQITKSSDAS